MLCQFHGQNTLPLPSLCIDLSTPQQDQRGADVSSYCDTLVAKPGVVSTPPQVPSICRCSSPAATDVLTDLDGKSHPLSLQGHLPLVAWPGSGIRTDQMEFQKELMRYSESHGESQLNLPTQVPGNSGIVGVVNGISIPSQPL